ncbi:FixH family protein [Pseudalkalibacillus hwajinpoensis]|uniref:FixH family protein n=1 Tax=Guptibacillus hwajinpoensis TaxID=208199 RepID=UPI00325C17CC
MNSTQVDAEKTNEEGMNEEETGDAMVREAAQAEDESEKSMSEPSLKKEIMEEISDGHHEDHHRPELNTMLENDTQDPAVLMTEVLEDGHQLVEADVRFEYWKEGEEKHTYTDAEEMGEGMYEAKIEIPEPRTYNMKVHVEKGEQLHSHKPYVLKVTEKDK